MEQEDIKQIVARQIREARRAKNVTLKELGERLSISEATASRYESGKQNLTIETLQKIADALDMNFATSIKA